MFSVCQCVTQSLMLHLFCFSLSCWSWGFWIYDTHLLDDATEVQRVNWLAHIPHSGAWTGAQKHPTSVWGVSEYVTWCLCTRLPLFVTPNLSILLYWLPLQSCWSSREFAGLQESSTCRSLLFLLWTFCLQHLTKPSVGWTEGSSHTSWVACLCLEAGSSKDHQAEKQLPFFHR